MPDLPSTCHLAVPQIGSDRTVSTIGRMIRICHIITGLDTGGAEKMLLKLVSTMDQSRFQNRVISLTGAGSLGSSFRALGIPIDEVRMSKNPVRWPGSFVRLQFLLKRAQPDLVQTWMYHANLLGGMAARLARIPVVWNLRRGWLDPEIDKRATIWTSRLCAALSARLPVKIVCCAIAAQEYHTAQGYSGEKMMFIPNGFDVTAFRPDHQTRESIRRQLEIPAEALLVGLIARFDPAKDHLTFLRAAASITSAHPAARFVLCGQGIEWSNAALVRWIDEMRLREHVHLLGNRQDIPQILASLDIAVCSSRVEGFPNAVGEAMATGVPVVVTDVGDTRQLVGTAGAIVPAGDPDALASGIERLCALGSFGRSRIGAAGRKRVFERFSLPVVTQQYELLYESLGRQESKASPCAASRLRTPVL